MSVNEIALTEANQTVWSYELIDELLNRMNKTGSYSIPFSIDTPVAKKAIEIMRKHSLIKISNINLLKTTLTITQKGKDVIIAGGIEKYFEFWSLL